MKRRIFVARQVKNMLNISGSTAYDNKMLRASLIFMNLLSSLSWCGICHCIDFFVTVYHVCGPKQHAIIPLPRSESRLELCVWDSSVLYGLFSILCSWSQCNLLILLIGFLLLGLLWIMSPWAFLYISPAAHAKIGYVTPRVSAYLSYQVA